MPPGKEPLRINLDETPVAQFHGYEQGNLFLRRKRRVDVKDEAVQRVQRRKLRSMLTHVALVCDNTDIQPLLPQILLTNEHIVSKRDYLSLIPRLPNNILLWREKSAWTNVGILERILKCLRMSLAPVAHKYQVILSMDCARQHVPPRVAQAATRQGFFLMYVPASLTWLLQPLDTHVFRRYKRLLASALQDARTKSERGDLTTQEWIHCICAATRKGLQGKSWSSAFADNGMCEAQTLVSAYIRSMIGGPVDDISAERPSLEQLSALFPRGMKIHGPSLFRPFDSGVPALPAIPDAEEGAALVLKWHLRPRPGAIVPEAPPCPAPAARAPRRRLTIRGAEQTTESRRAIRLRRPPSSPPGAGLETTTAAARPKASASGAPSAARSSSSKSGGML